MYKFILLIGLLFPVVVAAQNGKIKNETFFTAGNCEMCKERIEETAKQTKAQNAVWDINTHMLAISFDSTKTSIEKIQKKTGIGRARFGTF